MTDSDEVKLLPCPPLTITGLDGRLLFRVNADGTADGVVADASEAARIFAETAAPYFTRPSQSARIAELEGVLEPFANLADANMNDPLRKWLTVAHIQNAARASLTKDSTSAPG